MAIEYSDDGTRRVVVVGVGAVTSLGPTAADLWQGAVAGRVAIEPVQGVDMRGFQTKIGGEVTTLATVSRNDDESYRERAYDLAIVAAREALSVLPAGVVDPDRIGVVLGTCNAGLLSAREWLRRDVAGEPADPRLLALVTPGGLADALARELGFGGPVLAVNTACASGANAIGLAADLVRSGHADVVLAGGTDALSDVVFSGFSALEALSPLPAAPYSGNREGLSLGEGSGMVVLMSQFQADSVGLAAQAEVAGYGLSADGYHATAPRPDGSGAAEAIRAALLAAGVTAGQVGYVNGHGTGTPKNDPAETKAIQLALGGENVLVSSTKSMIGHLLGAAGAAEAIVTVGALAHQIAPPTAGYEDPDVNCPLDYVPNQARAMSTDVAISNNFAFGGANACLVLTRPRRVAAPPMPQLSDVVITGVAVLSPAGDGVETAGQAYSTGREAHSLVDGVRQGFVDVDVDPYLSRRDRRRMDRLSVLSVVSAHKALVSSGLVPNTADVARCGVLFGTGVGPMEAMERFTRPLLDAARVPGDPGVFPNTVYNQAAGQVALHLGLYGPTSTLSVGHATAAATLAYAADLIRHGRADLMVATVTDTLTSQVARAYLAAGLASDRVDGAPSDGRFALAEASVSLVLESRAAAEARGATVFGQVAGSGLSADGRAAAGRGMARAMRAALAAAGLPAQAVGDIWLANAEHGARERTERLAIAEVFATGGYARLHAPAVYLGEPMGAGGSLRAALAMHRWSGSAPVPALINSSSLGGSYISLLVTPAEPRNGAAS